MKYERLSIMIYMAKVKVKASMYCHENANETEGKELNMSGIRIVANGIPLSFPTLHGIKGVIIDRYTESDVNCFNTNRRTNKIELIPICHYNLKHLEFCAHFVRTSFN